MPKKTNTEKPDDSVTSQDGQIVEEVTAVTDTTPEIEKVSESPEQPTEGAATQTKGNRRRQRQRENKKKGKVQQQEQVQGDVEEQTDDTDEKVEAAAPLSSPSPSPLQSPTEPEKQPKQKKKQNNNNNNKKSKQQKRPPSPKEEEHNTGLYKNSVLKHLFLKQHGTDSVIETTAHEVAIKPIRQPRGPTAIGERGFSSEYRNSRTVKA